MTHEEWIGKVTHYYPRAHAAAVHVEGDLHLGDEIHVRAPGIDLRQEVTSLEIDRRSINEAHAGDDIGILMEQPVPEKADVFLVRP